MIESTTPAGSRWHRLSAYARRVPALVHRGGALARRVVRHGWTRRVGVGAMVALVGVVGVVVGVLLFAHAGLNVGPFRAQMTITPSLSGGTEVAIPPLGALHLNSHDGPIHLRVDLGSLDQSRVEALIDDPAGIGAAGQHAVEDVRTGVMRLGVRTLGIAVLSALVLAAVVFRDLRRVAAAGVTALVVTVGSLGLAALTLRPNSISEPRYEGLLVNAPAVVGDARRIADNYGQYAAQLQQIVSNVSRLYTTVSSMPVYQPAGNTTRILHVSDLHLNPSAWGLIRTVVQTFDIDAVVDTGDMVDWGSTAETSYVSAVGSLGVPYVYVRGNHDSKAIQAAVARQSNAVVLDNRVATVNGLTIAGIGDPQFTPDKSTTHPPADPGSSQLLDSGTKLAGTIRAHPSRVDLAMVHDPAMAPPLSGVVPLVLAGHLHQRQVSVLPATTATPTPTGSTPAPDASASPTPSPATMATRLLVEGSTGGAGLRGLEGDKPTPVMLSVLYFDEHHDLKAYDDIQLGGTGQSNVEMQRNVVGAKPDATPTPSVSASIVPQTQPSR